jgi:uncharacterized membrane protein
MMALIGRLHPLLIHFPIALVVVAAIAELAAAITADSGWRTVAVRNVRAGALFALMATIAGWRLAAAPEMDTPPLLEWHRWIGTAAAGAALAAALAAPAAARESAVQTRIYQTALLTAAALVGVAGHFGGVLVWGASFLRP